MCLSIYSAIVLNGSGLRDNSNAKNKFDFKKKVEYKGYKVLQVRNGRYYLPYFTTVSKINHKNNHEIERFKWYKDENNYYILFCNDVVRKKPREDDAYKTGFHIFRSLLDAIHECREFSIIGKYIIVEALFKNVTAYDNKAVCAREMYLGNEIDDKGNNELAK